jgi:AcrR family transcriptional regulator
MSAATELFASRGYEGAKVEAIARRARVNKALINYYYGGKRGLYHTILIATLSHARRRLEGLSERARPADQRLCEFVEAFVEVATRRPSFPAMVLREAIAGGRHLDRSVLPHFLALFEQVRGLIEQGIRERRFRPVDPVLTHLGLIGSLMFFFATREFRRRVLASRNAPLHEPKTIDYVHHIQELMARGLAARPGFSVR